MKVGLAGLRAAVDALAGADLDALAPAERFAVLEQLETARRRQAAVAHDLVGRREQVPGRPPVHIALCDVLRISRAEARRRRRDAEQLAPRTTLTGQPRPPHLPATATACHAGVLDAEHLRVIQKFLRDLPGHITADVIAHSEQILAEHAAALRPDQLEKLAERLALTVNPDGTFSEDDRARQRGFTWCGAQRVDGIASASSPPPPNCAR